MPATECRLLDWREWIAAIAVFSGLSFLFCNPAGLSSNTCILSGDALGSYFPYLLRSFDPLSASVAGPWDPTLLTGLPESHSPFGVYYPITIFLYGFFPPGQALSLGLVFHHALAGLGCYVLARTGRLSRSGAALAGIVFGFGGFLVFHRGHVPMHQAAAWLPWILWGFERFRQSGLFLWVAVTGTFLTLHALSSLMQMIVIGGFVWITYLIYFTIIGPRPELTPRRLSVPTVIAAEVKEMQPGWRWRFLLGGVGAGLLGAVGSLPQTLPMLEVARWSDYGQFHAAFFNDGYLKFRFLVGLAGPWVLGGNFGASYPNDYWGLTEHGIFYGVLPFTAAVAAILWYFFGKSKSANSWQRREGEAPAESCEKSERLGRSLALPKSPCLHVSLSFLPTRKEAGFWLLLLLESLVLMLGKTLPVHYLLAKMPIYQFFHLPARHVCAMGLALAWLAGFGLDLLRHMEDPLRKRLLNQLGGALLVLAGVFVLLIHSGSWPAGPNWTYPGFWIPALSAVVSFVLLRRVSKTTLHRGLAAAIVPLLAFFELALTIRNYDLTPSSVEILTKPADFPEVVNWLRERDDESLPPRCLIRKEAWVTNRDPIAVPAGFGSAWGLSSLSYYTQSMPRSLMGLLQLDYYGHADFGGLLAGERGLSAAAGRYILARGPLPRFAPGLGDQIEPAKAFDWKVEDQSPGHPSPLSAGNNPRQASTLVTSIATAPRQTYVVEGVLPSQGPRQGKVRVVRTTRPTAEILGEMTFRPSDYQPDGVHFACVFESGALSGAFWITLQCQDGQTILPPQIQMWHLTADFAKSATHLDPREVIRQLRAGIRQPYPQLATFPGDLRVYENPWARPLAGFVREIRPARNVREAVEGILSAGPQVRDVAYVVAPHGPIEGGDIAGPAYFEAGSAHLRCQRPDNLTVTTANRGEGFLVLAITRCLGWSATVDGKRVPIHAVDGPFMGVRVPPGEHIVRFQFRPVLMWAGTGLAILFLGGEWIGVILQALGRRRRRRQTFDDASGEFTSGQLARGNAA